MTHVEQVYRTHVEQIRRAARGMRHRAERASILMPDPWRKVVTDTESFSGIATCGDHAGEPFHVCDACSHFETGRESVAAHIAAWPPAVARAMADLLEAAANREAGYLSTEPHAGVPEAGEESYLAWQIAAAWLGEDGPQ